MRTLLTPTILLCSAMAVFGQGTVQFSNSALSRISTGSSVDYITPNGTAANVPTTPGQVEYGLFYGIGQSTSLTLLTSQFGVNSTTGAGLIANPADGSSAMNTVPIPGTTGGGETDVWVQVAAWSGIFGTDYAAAHAAFLSGAFYVGPYYGWGQSSIVNINGLGASAGPGVPIWQTSTGTNPHLLQAFAMLTPIPEPSVFALAGLAGMVFAFRKRG